MEETDKQAKKPRHTPKLENGITSNHEWCKQYFENTKHHKLIGKNKKTNTHTKTN